MKLKFYVNNTPQANGDHEVHIERCIYFPFIRNKTFLGEFESCVSAVHEAEKYHLKVNGCAYCCALCHTT